MTHYACDRCSSYFEADDAEAERTNEMIQSGTCFCGGVYRQIDAFEYRLLVEKHPIAPVQFYICNKCLAFFSDKARDDWEAVGKVSKGSFDCSCGGTYEPASQEAATGEHGALDTAVCRAQGAKPS